MKTAIKALQEKQKILKSEIRIWKEEKEKEIVKICQQEIEEINRAIKILSEYEESNNGYEFSVTIVHGELLYPVESVILFELKDGKYYAKNGREITTEILMMYDSVIYEGGGYIIANIDE